MSTQRREFLVASGSLVLAAGGLLALCTHDPNEAEPDEDMDDEAVDESLAAVRAAAQKFMPGLTFAAGTLQAFERDRKRYGPSSNEPRALAEQLLLSTDFFAQGANERRAIEYARYHDPYISPCHDPFRGKSEQTR